MINVIKEISVVVGCALSSITLITLAIKPFREKFLEWAELKSNTCELEDKIDRISDLLKSHIEHDDVKMNLFEMQSNATLCILRDRITTMYYTYMAIGCIPDHARENLVKLYGSYHAMHGNSYVDIIYEEMLELPIEK